MSSWRPELTAIAAETDALAPALRVPAAARRDGASRRGFSRGRVRALIASDVLAVALALAGTYALAELIGPPAVIAPSWLLVLMVPALIAGWLAVFAAYRLYEGQSRAIAPTSFDEVGEPLPRAAGRLARAAGGRPGAQEGLRRVPLLAAGGR